MTIELKQPTLLLEGGPWDGRGYYVDDWTALLATEQWAESLGHGRNIAPHYRSTKRMEVHPQTNGQLSQRWEWRPPEGWTPPAGRRPKPFVAPPSKSEHVRAVLSMAGRTGLTVEGVTEALRAIQVEIGRAAQVAPLLWWMVQRRELEASPFAPTHYRIMGAR